MRTATSPRRTPRAASALIVVLSLWYSVVPAVHANTSAHAEKRRYTSEDVPEGGPRFEDYHQLLDHYYTAGMTEDELYDSLRETMTYRLSLPQKYYEGAGYIPGVDEGTLPTINNGNGGRREITVGEYWRHRKKNEKIVKEAENKKPKKGRKNKKPKKGKKNKKPKKGKQKAQ
eukprot:CAMPEP_0113589308 /NCGR_PEP_ID=MMETSP0015_2-20120614/36010_1 /TAXON_ID=2838 /ORGANISM="Odontella" /LENGTH=172 /DNA_ID=CAMNT_0000495301 /DNA_START=187 /DNA_END=705 /DNA_ORIENTATION=+ /assembly_acc=CAM_ASM_000160